ncbi:hypothetical protein [Acinetobacter haemolyticus]|uniref:Uncharacterized protein n=1 Tax=Acinetobacter haemolyticus TaxID=29430 RepID=A0A4P7B3X2_ACIHA|nr:hypothetical protein [Acinetobacter haemolyticus]QBQ15618.1 hypothetical protein AHTJR_04750 [Acinetobacter haemolyticus]
MRYFYIKKGKQYLHFQQSLFEEYQDYSDISAMVTQQYVFLDSKDDAIKFLEKREADYFMLTRGWKLKDVKVVRE